MPPQNRWPVASGEYDYPPALPANALASSRAVLEVASRLQLAHDRRRGYLPAEPPPPISQTTRSTAQGERPLTYPSSSSNPQRRMRSILRRIRNQGDDTSQSNQYPPPVVPQRSTQRPVAQPSQTFQRLREQRERIMSTTPEAGSSGSDTFLRDGIEHLAQVNDDLRHLLEMPLDSNYSYPTQQPPPYAMRGGSAIDDDRARRKRRKIDTTPEKRYSDFKYGHFGQVVAGKLRMSLVSNDGGSYGRPSTYEADNVLKDDHTVYSSKRPRANMILAHEGETAFSLTKLVVKAPKHGFTDPVQQGLVFISMEREPAFDNTVAYQMFLYSDSSFAKLSSHDEIPCNTSSQVSDEGWLNQYDSCDDDSDEEEVGDIDDVEIHDRHQAVTISASDTSSVADAEMLYPPQPPPIQSTGTETDGLQGFDFASFIAMSPPEIEHIVQRGAEAQADRQNRRAQRGDGYPDVALPLNYRSDLQRLQVGARANVTSSGPPATSSDVESQPQRHQMRATRSQHSGLRQTWSPGEASRPSTSQSGFEPSSERDHMDIQHSPEPDDPDNSYPDMYPHDQHEDYRGAVSPDLLTPDARFSMERGNSKVVIKFDPPLSGKYILLKLWTPRQSGNIDVQSVMAYGFAGPRYFPAMEMR